jgi:predicted kinase
MSKTGNLIFFGGHSHSGKSTKALALGEKLNAPVFSIDHWVSVISRPNRSVEKYMENYPKCLELMRETAIDLLRKGTDVIFDFGGNTKADRAWIKTLLNETGATHDLYLMNTPVEICKKRFTQSESTDKMPLDHFEKLIRRIDIPHSSEGFNITEIEFDK